MHASRSAPVLTSRRRVTGRCLPLQVNRIKIPKQLDELVEMQNESANPVLKVLSKIKAELRGVRLCFFCYFSPFFCADFRYEQTTCFFFFFLTDLGNIHEMLQLPSERQHDQAGCRLVHTLFWVGRFFCFFLKKRTPFFHIIVPDFCHAERHLAESSLRPTLA